MNVPYLECSSSSGEGLNSVFRAAVRTILYTKETKESSSYKQIKSKEFPYLYMSPGERGMFQSKTARSISKAMVIDNWQMKYTEEGDQVRKSLYEISNF
jgi:hypothetical protein